ncbi:hypothetical protein TNCT_562431 [Trichonephila clavata]|nr:hypothetical protein TNCT_562431 [Trichonephila clavata]
MNAYAEPFSDIDSSAFTEFRKLVYMQNHFPTSTREQVPKFGKSVSSHTRFGYAEPFSDIDSRASSQVRKELVEAALASRWTKESTVVTVDTTRYVYTEEGPRIELMCDPDDTWDPFSISGHRSTRGRIMFRDLPRERRGTQYDGAHQGEGTKRNLRKFWDV